MELEEELQSRVASVASHRVKIERLQAELALLGTQELGLKHALASDLGPTAVRGEIPYLSPLFFIDEVENLVKSSCSLGTQEPGVCDDAIKRYVYC